ncbi:integrin alpha-9-like isoform X2 [Apostichopus japonicus]|uniref:integrin alpha-9-like isoform X2 n=1 Tax=Stichopus japonicus TaxID=307972 RepID=UPI003AB3EA00
MGRMPKNLGCPLCGSLTVKSPNEQSKSSMSKIPFTSSHRMQNSLRILIVIFVFLIGICNGCNLDTTEPIRYKGDDGDYFGYTVLQYENSLSSTYVLIGAPRGNSEHQRTLTRPGKVYRCSSADTMCDQLELDTMGNEDMPGRIDFKNNQWLGVSLSTESKDEGLISACGHRYANDYFVGRETDFDKNDRYPIGVCYNFRIGILGLIDLEKTFPCLDGDQWRGDTRWLSWCQAGLDSAFTNKGEMALYGAPGAYNSTGTVVSYSTSFEYPEPEVFTDETEYETDYTGYAVSSGHFVGPARDVQGVAGAPRAKELGKVTIYDISNSTVYQEIYGEPMTTYFGSAIASVDLNNDGLSDLLVGAPLYSSNQDEGKVYVYLNTGSQDEPLKLAQEIQGSKAFRARFGSSINYCGDLNKDKFNDVIIGAPYEDDGAGAIYIYLGAADGVDTTYSQRISGASLDPPVKTFGISVHGGKDMDLNLYPDIVVGAYESDTAFLFKAKPIIEILAWLELSPDSVDPDLTTCSLNGEDYVCVQVTACFQFSGVSPTFDLDIEFSIDVDEENTKAGIESRFLLTESKLTHVDGMVGIPGENIRTCADSYTAYLSDKARDLLTPVPMKLTYDVFKYPVVTSVRGDEPLPFPGGLPPVSNSYDCEAQYVTEEVIFVQNCGSDGICQTDIELNVEAELPGNKRDELILGASPTLYINAKIDNNGEEAHQAILKVYHPSDMGYEGVEIEAVTCLPLADQRGDTCTAEIVANCLPQIGQDASAIVECSLGNPMNAYNSATLKLRFDVSDIPWSQEREINITMVVYTVSIETEEEKPNNMKQLKFSVIVEADLGVIGTSQGESVYYGYNATSTGQSDQQAADEFRLDQAVKAVELFYDHDGDESRYNQSHIGPAFNHEFQVINYGPGRLPLNSNVTIQIPWRNVDGGALVFIKGIKINANKGSCNEARILELQRRRIEEAYVAKGSTKISYAEEEDSDQQIATASDPTQLGCEKAKCVDLSCNIALLERDELVKITVEMLLWEHTFVSRQYGFVEVVSQGLVVSDDPTNIHNQPEGHEADSVQIQTVAYTGTMGTQPIPWWVILLAILLGILFLIIAVVVLWKLGFFKRGLQETMAGGFEAVPATEPAVE